MGTIIARFADGRLLVSESRVVSTTYVGSGIPVRIGNIKKIEHVLSLTTDLARLGLVTPLEEAWTGYKTSGGVWSGQNQELGDHLMVVMRRGDVPIATLNQPSSGLINISGGASQGLLSGITSGLAFMNELLSGVALVSGKVKVVANVIGY